MLGADEPLPGGRVGGVGCQDLTIEAGGLVGAVGLLEEDGVFELGDGFEAVSACRKWEVEGVGEDALGLGLAAYGGIGGCQGAEEVGVLHELRVDGGRDALVGVEGLRWGSGGELGHEEAAPCTGGGSVDLGVAGEDLDGGSGLVGLKEGAAEAFEGLGAGGAHDEGEAVLLLGGGEIVVVEGLASLAEDGVKAGGGECGFEAGVAGAFVFGLFEEADGSNEVRLLHADVAQAGEDSRIVWVVGEEGLEALIGFGDARGVEGAVGGFELQVEGTVAGLGALFGGA